MTIKSLFLCVLMGLSLGACAQNPMRPQLVAEPNAVDLRLADAADRATRALESLAAVEQNRTPAVGAATLPNVPAELQKAVTLSWTGPIEPLLQTISGKIGYNYATVGQKPATPLIVTVNATNMPVAELLRNVGLQLGTRGTLHLDGATRAIELLYPSGN